MAETRGEERCTTGKERSGVGDKGKGVEETRQEKRSGGMKVEVIEEEGVDEKEVREKGVREIFCDANV